MYTKYEDGRVGFKVNRKTFIINKQLWVKLKESYGSAFTFEVKDDETYQVFLKNKKQEVDEAVDLTNKDDSNHSEVDYLPTEKDLVYPIMNEKKETESPGKRMNTSVRFLWGEDRISVLEKIRKSRFAEVGNIIDLARSDAYSLMNEKKEARRCTTREDNDGLDEYISQPSVEIAQDCIAPPVGFKNYGANCYVNASLQCLLSIPEMNTYFLDGHYKQTKCTTKKSDFNVCDTISQLYQEVFADPTPSWVGPKKVATMLPSGQQDAHEFIWKKLFTHIQDETNPKVKKPRKENMDHKQSWEWYKRNYNSIFDILFAGLYESRVECEVCHNISTTYDPFLDISLPISKKSLESCLKLHFQDEELSKSDCYKCEKCKKPVDAIKSLKIAKPPRYLILHLKRLVGGSKKISTFIQYPHVLDMAEYCSEATKEAAYSLFALCVHNGGAQSGHYYALGRRGTKVFC